MQLPSILQWLKPHWKSIIIIVWPLILLPLIVVSGTTEARCGYVVLVMAIFWMTEAVPLPVTSLIPVMLFPLLGVMSTDSVCIVYLKETNMMFIGGLIVAIAIEHCNLHKRIALKVLLLVGTSPRLLMLGFMLNTMFLSMWISNTACTAMMVPIVQAVLAELKESNFSRRNSSIRVKNGSVVEGDRPRRLSGSYPGVTRNGSIVDTDPRRSSNVSAIVTISQPSTLETTQLKLQEEKRLEEKEKEFTKSTICYYLGVAYAANIGGTGTITGTGTNLTFMGVFQDIFPDATGLNFASWMVFNVPVMLINVFLAWTWLQIMYMGLLTRGCRASPKVGDNSAGVRELISRKYRELGPMTWHEGSVLTLFILVVLLWFFRAPEFIPGWASLLPAVSIKDATPVMVIVFLLFALPADLNFLNFNKKGKKASPSLLTWRVVHEKLPWGLILLLGGGFAMAEGSKVSGLNSWLGQQLVVLQPLPTWLIVTIICLMSTFATEVSSNTAIANILLPVLAEMSKVIEVHPLYLMMPCTLCCSYSFMLPVATPPNAIVQQASNMKTKEMIKTGIMMNLLTVAVLIVSFNSLGPLVYGLHTFPDWAQDPVTTTISSLVLNTTSPNFEL